MKQLKLVVLSLAALVFGRPAGFCTANSKTEEAHKPKEPTLEDRVAAMEIENAELKRQLSLPPVLNPAPTDGPLAMLCKGAGVDLADVRWRMQAGLDAEQAVEAAMSQRDSDATGKKHTKSAK